LQLLVWPSSEDMAGNSNCSMHHAVMTCCTWVCTSATHDTTRRLVVALRSICAAVCANQTCRRAWRVPYICLVANLLQASCGFCLPPLASPLAVDSSSKKGSSSSTQQNVAGSLQDSSSSSRGSRDGTALYTLLDDCQDDINVCPYLAFTGLCGSDSLWIVTQCPRSCKKCSPSFITGGAGETVMRFTLTVLL
jgi:hypothetical protein